MLETVGKKDLKELFNSIPSRYRLKENGLDLPSGLSEHEAREKLTSLAATNKTISSRKAFLGAGAYYHHIPSALNHIVMRSEFYTAYTPYQPEVSQGTLQAVFEFQTMMCRLTGMDVSNASMYDGATAMAEAVLVAYRYKREKKNTVLVPDNIHPEYLAVLNNYVSPFGLNILKVKNDSKTGELDIADLKSKIQGVLAVIVQSPNFFGVVESKASEITKLAAENEVVSICTVIESTSLGLFKSPGELGFDVAVLEIQSLGNPVAFGGPYAGVICAKKDLIRFMPGRIIGETKDVDGKRAYVLTLATREQHIRREKATSNICSNQALVALRTAVYLSLVGEKGYTELAKKNYENAHYAKEALEKTGAVVKYSGVFYNEFIVELASKDLMDKVYAGLKKAGFIPGYRLSDMQMLVTVTECQRPEDIDSYVENFRRCLN
jgi:glycine dehydrogenase subunit 1